MAESTATESSNYDHPEEPLLIPAIVEATGLPMEYLTTDLQTKPLGNTRYAKVRKSETVLSKNKTSTRQPIYIDMDIPDCIVEELQTTPYSHLLGQGVLIRDTFSTHTSFITIAEAAFTQLNDLHDLLECLLIAISQAVNNESNPADWTLSWEVDTLWVGQVEDNSILRDIILDKVKKRETVEEPVSSYAESDLHQAQVLSSNPPSLVRLTTISTSNNPSSHSPVSKSRKRQRSYKDATNRSQKSASVIPVGRDELRPERSKVSIVQSQSPEYSVSWDWLDEAERRWNSEKALMESMEGLRRDRTSKKTSRNTTIVEDEPTEAEIDSPSVSVKQDMVHESPLQVSYHRGCWTVVTTLESYGSTKLADIRTVLQWLQIILEQPPGEHLLKHGTWLRVLERGDWSLSLMDLKYEVASPPHNGCWRRKILEGKALRVNERHRKDTYLSTPIIRPAPWRGHWVPQMEAGLKLTTACLWSLFDNTLRRVPNCTCTFISEGGDYLQCKKKIGLWLLWHIPDATEEQCRGRRCQANVPVSFVPTDGSERILMNTPCILDWTAETRHYATRPIAKTVSISPAMGKRKMVKRQVDSLQAQISLSAALPVAPQILGGVTFSKKRYKIANSIDHDSELAMNIAAAAIVLIYCEKSGIHLNMNGAELLETLCVSLLNQMDCREYPSCFDSGTAETRLQSWRNSTFLTSFLSVVAGSALVRQASKLVTGLLECTKNISKGSNGKPVYWTLESLLQQSEEEALLPPKHNAHVSWHALASKAPPLILAVGEIDPRLVTGSDEPLLWLGQGTPLKSTGKNFDFEWFSKSTKSSKCGGLVTNQRLFERWVRYATTSSFRGQLIITTDKVSHKNTVPGIECSFRIEDVVDRTVTNPRENLFFGCTACSRTADRQCLHYIQ
ncbi:hypothetical protein MMC18_005568 [Xylographa bjoerkii]|nr:hypothetical protein [Xylographa bjoerkii]